ncbi:MAG: aspartate kinase [Bacteroidales bacterium]|jgi:aspartate kinase|nr:aspartate kinase [Bacteroidales bacterium]OQA84816.1 MAG: Lysine-sensitive aspartokinase 3 [Bacteroidetes bacterium ADurb.Bin234]
MKVFKFGGMSIKDAEAIKNVNHILSLYDKEKIVSVISAIGKTTNQLEMIVETFYANKAEKFNLFHDIKTAHLQIVAGLFTAEDVDVNKDINATLNALEDYLHKEASENYDFEYDQIVSYGEILSSKIVYHYLKKQYIPVVWIDARKLIITDNNYREANINWEKTEKKIQKTITHHFKTNRLIITQGFIGGTLEGISTTLGREGSDFSAAIFAHAMDAESVSIWKDVEGLLNADPKKFSHTVKLDKIPYREAIELAYYGANVIHPKTLKPLQNKKIPLFVKSFMQPEEEGSIIHDFKNQKNIPCFIKKTRQILLSISPKDFSFIAEENLSTIFAIFAFFGFKINLMQNSAISFSVCVDYRNNLAQLIEELQTEFFVKYNENVELLTVRHYTEDSLNGLTDNKKIILEQRNRTTLQVVLK